MGLFHLGSYIFQEFCQRKGHWRQIKMMSFYKSPWKHRPESWSRQKFPLSFCYHRPTVHVFPNPSPVTGVSRRRQYVESEVNVQVTAVQTWRVISKYMWFSLKKRGLKWPQCLDNTLTLSRSLSNTFLHTFQHWLRLNQLFLNHSFNLWFAAVFTYFWVNVTFVSTKINFQSLDFLKIIPSNGHDDIHYCSDQRSRQQQQQQHYSNGVI